jgi:hypothetical protein
MRGADLQKRWRRDGAGVLDEGAACGKPTALRRRTHVRNDAFYGGKMRGAAIEARNRTD